jgi:hypothetical protein
MHDVYFICINLFRNKKFVNLISKAHVDQIDSRGF